MICLCSQLEHTDRYFSREGKLPRNPQICLMQGQSLTGTKTANQQRSVTSPHVARSYRLAEVVAQILTHTFDGWMHWWIEGKKAIEMGLTSVYTHRLLIVCLQVTMVAEEAYGHSLPGWWVKLQWMTGDNVS